MANLTGKHCYQLDPKLWKGHTCLVSNFYLHLGVIPCWYEAKLDHQLEINDPLDACNVFLYTCPDFIPTAHVLFDESTSNLYPHQLDHIPLNISHKQSLRETLKNIVSTQKPTNYKT